MAPQVHRLFFALRPDAALRDELQHAIAKLRAARGFRGRWLKPENLHLSLQFLGDFIAADEIVRCAVGAAASLRFAPFEFVLDHVETFPRRFNPPCVLRCAAESEAPLLALSRELGTALVAAGLGAHLETRPYVPHLTIAYAERPLPQTVAITPIVWKVREFGLMDSLVGQAIHRELQHWPLA